VVYSFFHATFQDLLSPSFPAGFFILCYLILFVSMIETTKGNVMSKNETTPEKVYPTPVVTERTRKPRKGFENPNKGIPVAAGLNMQDVPRGMIIEHLRVNEELAKQRFKAKYANVGGSQSF
jgi:hypothetical protein